MTDRPTTEPRTEAGQKYLDQPPGSLDEWRTAILAIEAEAAQGAAPLTDEQYLARESVREARQTAWPQLYRSEGAAPRAEGLDVERLIDTSAAALILEGVRELQRNRGRLSKVTVEDMRRLLLLVVDASARLSRPSDERVPEDQP